MLKHDELQDRQDWDRPDAPTAGRSIKGFETEGTKTASRNKRGAAVADRE